MNINKQETLKESTKKLILDEWLGDDKTPNLVKWGIEIGFEKGVKWKEEQNKNRYSEEEVREAFKIGHRCARQGSYNDITEQEDFTEWFEQFKKSNYGFQNGISKVGLQQR